MSSPSTRKLSLALTCVLLAAAAPSRGEEPRASPESAPERRPDRPPAPRPDFSALPVADVTVDLTADLGPFEPWRHAIGHGGINAAPLPDRVVAGISRLRPRRIRVFIQEFFRVYPERDRLDWSRLDPYMDALARTGATVVAAITIKPKPLYPAVDQRVWRPNDVAEWQRVVAALARRYSVEKRIVSHWEIGN
ncbi:MAG: hypothetical protein HY721_21945, partial [Planctomycetes bacterium]|nr:hypothetical protein [Planctomycetota bacterium]